MYPTFPKYRMLTGLYTFHFYAVRLPASCSRIRSCVFSPASLSNCVMAKPWVFPPADRYAVVTAQWKVDLPASCYIKSVNVPESVKNIFKNRSAEHGKRANGRAESQRKTFLPSGFLRNFSSSHEGRFPAKLLQKAPESYRNPGQSAMGYADRKTMAALIGIFG